MYDDGSSDDLLNRKSLIIEYAVSIPLIAHKRGHVAGVIRMLCVLGIVVHAGMGKGIVAVPCFVYVHGIEAAGTGKGDVRKIENLGFYQYAAVSGMIKFDQTIQSGIIFITVDPGDRARMILEEKLCEDSCGCELRMIHGKAPVGFAISL